MRILGEDGDGYELTVRLENAGSLREWLGAASYTKLMPYLASKAAWHSFMNSTSPVLLNLQMRVRALLFDKAAGCVYEDFGDVVAPSSLNPSYLQLNGSAVYFPLDQDAEDFKRYQATTSRTPTTPLRHQSYMAKGQASQGQHAHNGSRRNLEDSHETKGVGTVSQQRHASQGGHTFNSMMSSKQETSKPSLNKVKKVEAWDSNDATKRPMEMIGGTINKKLRSPKISSKATFQTDGTGVPVRDHQDKTGSYKIAGGFARSSEENSKVSTSAGMGRVGHATDTGDVGPLWYDQCAKTYLSERMQRLAQRAAQQKLPFPEREGLPRTPEGMVAYIEFNAKRQKTMSVVKPVPDSPGTLSDGQTPRSSNEADKVKGDSTFVPDLKFLANCVPDNPVPAKRRRLERCDHQPKGILDNLNELELCSPTGSKGTEMEEARLPCESRLAQRKDNFDAKKDLGLLPDSSESERPANKVREYGADQMLRQTVAKLVADAGFEGLKQSSLDLFVDVLDSRFKRLSTGMRVLIDSYRRQCSQAEYLKMFIQISDSSMEDMMEQVKVGVQKQQLQEKQRLEQRLEQEQLHLQKQEQEVEKLLLQQRQQREDIQQQKQQEEQEMLQQEDQLLKQRQAEETQSHQQQQQNPQKQRPLDQHPSPRRTDIHSQQQQQQPQQKIRQPDKQPLQSPQHQQQQPQKQRQVDQQHSQQQQYLQKQRQPDYQHTQQQQQSSHFPSHKRKPQQTQSPSRQGLPGKPASMRAPSAPSAIDTVLKQARKACSETMEQHKQKADQVMGLIKQHPQKMSQMSMLAHAQRHAPVGSPTKGLLTKSPDAYSGLMHQRQSVPQQTSVDKAQKRKQQQASMGRHSPNIGRNQKKGEKERALDGKPIGETRPVVGKKAMQMMSGGNSSSWHPSIPIVKSQTSPMLQHMKQQQASSLQP